jgi:hypothetical protein
MNRCSNGVLTICRNLCSRTRVFVQVLYWFPKSRKHRPSWGVISCWAGQILRLLWKRNCFIGLRCPAAGAYQIRIIIHCSIKIGFNSTFPYAKQAGSPSPRKIPISICVVKVDCLNLFWVSSVSQRKSHDCTYKGTTISFKLNIHTNSAVRNSIGESFYALSLSVVLFQFQEKHHYPVGGHDRSCREGPLELRAQSHWFASTFWQRELRIKACPGVSFRKSTGELYVSAFSRYRYTRPFLGAQPSPPMFPSSLAGKSTQYLPTFFPKIHFNIFLSSTPRSSEWSFSIRFLTSVMY